MNTNTPNQRQAPHYLIIDVARGFAISLMIAYHFCFDLNYYGLITQHFNHDPFWLHFRTLIVSLFLLVMGISLSVATSRGLNTKRYFKRLGLLLFCAVLVSISTYVTFPKSMVFFGILHFILLASIIGLLFKRWYWLNLIFGLAIIIFALTVSAPLFDTGYLQWIGLMTHKPITQDYVPMLPWFGVVLIGMFLGNLLFTKRTPQYLLRCRQWSSDSKIAKLLTLGGRHSLLIYILHQPILMGLMAIVISTIR